MADSMSPHGVYILTDLGRLECALQVSAPERNRIRAITLDNLEHLVEAWHEHDGESRPTK